MTRAFYLLLLPLLGCGDCEIQRCAEYADTYHTTTVFVPVGKVLVPTQHLVRDCRRWEGPQP